MYLRYRYKRGCIFCIFRYCIQDTPQPCKILQILNFTFTIFEATEVKLTIIDTFNRGKWTTAIPKEACRAQWRDLEEVH